MDFWTDELKLAQRRVIEVERKIALQRQKKEQDHLLGLDTSQHMRLIAVMQESRRERKFTFNTSSAELRCTAAKLTVASPRATVRAGLDPTLEARPESEQMVDLPKNMECVNITWWICGAASGPTYGFGKFRIAESHKERECGAAISNPTTQQSGLADRRSMNF